MTACGSSASSWIRMARAAGVRPFGADDLGEPLGRYLDRGVQGAGGRIDDVEVPERDVAADRQRRRQAEGADAADRMASESERLFRSEHPRPPAERGLALDVVEPRVAAGDEQKHLVLHANGERLGD